MSTITAEPRVAGSENIVSRVPDALPIAVNEYGVTGVEVDGMVVPLPGRFATVAEIRTENRLNRHCFFSRDTMRYFGSKVLDGVYGGRMFVTSERYGFDGIGRLYSVRVADDNGTISTLGTRFTDSRTARTYAKRIAEALSA